jgi:potassium-transporting ATPase potassium-binding subunit
MTFFGWLQVGVLLLVVLAITKPLGAYLHRVFEGEQQPLPRVLGRLERILLRASGLAHPAAQDWKQYTAALLVFSTLGTLVTYFLQRLQASLPLNPEHLPGPVPHLAFNTAVSFATNTNWQSYAGETTMSYLTQMAGLAWHNFTSAAAGLGVALALARGLTRRPDEQEAKGLGNFWVDVMRAIVYVLLPISVIGTLFLVSQGGVQSLGSYLHVTGLDGNPQVIPQGPVASQEIIKELGTNGGGFFNANSAHPFENPTPLTNFVEMLLILSIPAASTYMFGRMARDQKQGWAILSAMAVLLVTGIALAYASESRPNAALASLSLDHGAGNLEGKETRVGVASSALWAAVTTATSCGAVNAMHDSFNPLGGMVPLVNIKLGEVAFGGVGAGLFGMLMFVLLSVFIAGLMVGRTPEYLGKKIEAKEVKLVMLYVLVFPLMILGLSAWSSVASYGRAALGNAGPHGLSEILYAYASGTGNNGSAFAGLAANTPWWDVTLAVAMLGGRFFMIVPVLAMAGSMRDKQPLPAGPGTFPTHGLLFSGLLVAVILVVGALTFFPALSLGPVAEHFSAAAGKVY